MTLKPGTKRRRGRNGSIRIKVLPKDPLLARTRNLWPVEATIECATVGDGPTSARVAIVDYNADLDTRFTPARLLADRSGFVGIAGLKNERILDNFNFHQVNVWAIIEQVLTVLEDDTALGRPVPWRRASDACWCCRMLATMTTRFTIAIPARCTFAISKAPTASRSIPACRMTSSRMNSATQYSMG